MLAMLLAQAATNEEVQTLNTAGWVVMGVSIVIVLTLNAFCFWRILREPAPSETHHAPLDIDTHHSNDDND